MRKLEAIKIDWPMGVWYFIEREELPYYLFRKKEDVIKHYWPKLLEILETGWRYESPEPPKDQLFISFPKDNETDVH